MLNDKLIGKSTMSRKNYLLVDIDLLRKEDLAQRRKLRIQQVRLQSKDLANRMLQDVRNERNHQLRVMQSKQTDSFKKWHSRKIHEINLKYKENVNFYGASQRAAAALPDPEKEILELAKKNSEIAHKRGKMALDQLKIEKDISREQQEKSVAQREKVKKLENVRASIVSSLSATGEKKKSPQKFPDAMNTAEEEPQQKYVGKQSSQDINIPPIIPQLHLDEALTERKMKKTPSTFTKRTVPDAEVPHSIEFYDKHNPCTITQRQPPSVRVERQSPTSQTNACEAAEMEEREEAERNVLSKELEDEIMRRKRGKKALAKEMVRRDYDRLLSCLDGLARKERLARGMGNPKVPPEAFMNEERASLKAHTRQQNLESAFEGVLHGNKAVKLREDPLPSKAVSPPPIVVEKANFPSQWLEVGEFIPQNPEMPPHKLNMGVCDEVSVPSTSGYEAESSQSSHHSSVKLDEMNFSDAEPDDSPKEVVLKRMPEKKTMPTIVENKGEDERDVREKHKRRIKKPAKEQEVEEESEAVDGESVSRVQQTMQVDEENIISMCVDRATSPVWWCSLDSEEIMPQSPQEGGEKKGSNIFIHEIRKVTAIQEDRGRSQTIEQSISRLQRRESDAASPDAKSGESEALSSSSLSIEEIHVKVKFDRSPSKAESSDEKIGSKHKVPQSPKRITFNRKSHKERKKKTSRRDQAHIPKKMAMPEEIVEDVVDVPEAEERPLVDKEKVDSISVETQTKMESPPKTERKIKRGKKESQKQKVGLPLSSSDSSYLSPPKHLDISDSDRAKVLLEEIRAQRKRLEDWVGFNQAERIERDSRVGEYVKKLLTMSRESVENLSVSDVSTSTIRQHSPVVFPSSPRKEALAEKKFEDKSVGTSFDEEMKMQDIGKKKKRKSVKEPSVVGISDVKEPSKLESGSNSPIEISSSTSSGSVSEGIGSDRLPRGPAPPPPSPEFDELSVFHSKRISELGAKLMELRETKKRILIAPNVSDRESTSSHQSPNSSSGSERISASPQKSVASDESVNSPSSEGSGPRKSWELLLDAGNIAGETEKLQPKNVSSDDSEGLSVLGDELLESIRLLEPKISFKPSEEMKAAQKMWSRKTGLPPPTAMKGGIWIGNEFQVPHELSTITEVDSKLLSTTSALEPRKEMDLSTLGTRIQPHPVPSEDLQPNEETPEMSLTELPSPILASAKALGLTSPDGRSPEDGMPFQDLGNEDHITANIEDSTKIAEISGLEEVSDASLSFSSSSSDGSSSKFPSNIDDVLRMLGISPTIFQGRKSPSSQDNRSSPTSPNIKISATQFKDNPLDHRPGNVSGGPLSSSIVGTRVKVREKVIHSTPSHQLRDAADVSSTSTPGTKGGSNKEAIDRVKDSEKIHSEAQFTPIHLFADSSFGAVVGRQSTKLEVGGVRQTSISEGPGQNLSSLLFPSSAPLRDFTLNATLCSVSENKSEVKGQSMIRGADEDDSRLQKPEFVLRGRRQSSPEKSLGESLHVTKGEHTPASLLRHSTPVHSLSGMSSSTSSESHSKGGGFPFFGDSAPSSISAGNSTGGGVNWRNLEDDDDDSENSAK